MATIITIDLDTLDEDVAQRLAKDVVRYINLEAAGRFGYPVIQGTIVQHIPEPLALSHPCCGVRKGDFCAC